MFRRQRNKKKNRKKREKKQTKENSTLEEQSHAISDILDQDLRYTDKSAGFFAEYQANVHKDLAVISEKLSAANDFFGEKISSPNSLKIDPKNCHS